MFWKVFLVIVAFFILSFFTLIYLKNFEPNDKFDRSMGINQINILYLKLFNNKKYQQYIKFKRNYYQSIDLNQNSKGNIPKIIHQIWVGGKKIPNQYLYYQATWKKRHPKWRFVLWTDGDVNKMDPKIQELFKRARSFAEQADIIRLEVLKEYGGVYVDMDTECFASFDELVGSYNFVAVTASTDLDFEVTNSFIASEKAHPIVLNAINYMKKNWQKIEDKFDSGNREVTFHGLARRRTMFPLEYAVDDYLSKNPEDRDVKVLPIGYCNPFYKNLDNLLHKIIYGEYKYKITKERMCIHYNRKYLSILPTKDFLLSIFEGSYLKKYLYKYFYGRNITNRMLENIYEINNPARVEFNPISKIPMVIHLIPDDNQDIDKVVSGWRDLNPDFELKVWHRDSLIDLVGEKLNDFAKGLRILEKQGGVLVSPSIEPTTIEPEYCNKYKLFSWMNHKDVLIGDLSISSAIIGATPKQKIISQTLEQLEKGGDVSSSEEVFTKNFYNFWMLDGPVIALP